MARKKIVKRSAKQANKKTLSLAASLEKEFKAMPAKLIAQFRKELAVLKQQETKLSAALKKAQSKLKTARNKAPAKKTVEQLTAALATIKAEGKVLSNNRAKFAAIAKEIAGVEKQWSAKKPAAKPAKKSKKLARVKISQEKFDQTNTNVVSIAEPTESAA